MTFTSEKPLQTFIICNFYVIFCKFRIKNEILKVSKRGRGAEGGGEWGEKPRVGRDMKVETSTDLFLSFIDFD